MTAEVGRARTFFTSLVLMDAFAVEPEYRPLADVGKATTTG
jgi:hypothetical protein